MAAKACDMPLNQLHCRVFHLARSLQIPAVPNGEARYRSSIVVSEILAVIAW